MSVRLPLSALALAAIALASRAAQADIPPDPDSPDAHCSLAEQCPTGVFCDYSFNPGAPEAEWKRVGEDCRVAAGAKGLKSRCRDGGNYGGQELFCPPGATGSWSPAGQKATPTPAPTPAPTAETTPAPAKSSSCAVTAESPLVGLAWVALALALVRRRR